MKWTRPGEQMESSKEEIDSLNQTKSELIWLMKQVKYAHDLVDKQEK